MRPIANTEDHFGIIAILFHWAMALMVIGLAGLGLYMVTLPDVGFNTTKIMLILYHKEFGLLALVLLAARFAWRVTTYCRNWLHSCPIGKNSPPDLSIFASMP